MKIRVFLLVVATLGSGCTTSDLFNKVVLYDNLAPECPGQTTKATTRAASCMTAAGIWLALEEAKASGDASTGDEASPVVYWGPALESCSDTNAAPDLPSRACRSGAEYAVAREKAMDSLAEDAARAEEEP